MILSEDVIIEEVSGETVILHIATNKLLGLNESGRVLLHELRTGAEREDLEILLVSTFGISRDRASADVGTFLDALRERDMLIDSK